MEFITKLISQSPELVGIQFKKDKEVFKSFYQFIHKDPPSFVLSILSIIYNKVIMNNTVSNKTKALITHIQSIEIMISLYNSSYNRLRKFIHKYLLALLCNEDTKIFSISYDSNGLPQINDNDPIMKLLKFLLPINDPYQKHLLLRLLKTFPQYRSRYNIILSLNLEPRLSLKWLSSIHYIKELLDLDIYLSNYHIQQFISENIVFEGTDYIVQFFPLIINKAIITRCIYSKISIVEFEILELLQKIINIMNKIINKLTDIIKNPNKYEGSFSSANEIELYSRISRIIDIFIQYLPDPQVILAIRSYFTLNLESSKTILLHSQVYNVLYDLITVLSPLLQKCNLQPNKLITIDFCNYPSLLQYPLLKLINYINPLPQTWINQTKLSTDGIKSLIMTLINKNTNNEIKRIIDKFLFNLFQCSDILPSGLYHEIFYYILLSTVKESNIDYFIEIIQSTSINGEYLNLLSQYFEQEKSQIDNFYLIYSAVYLLLTKYSIGLEKYVCFVIRSLISIYSIDDFSIIFKPLLSNKLLPIIYGDKYNSSNIKEEKYDLISSLFSKETKKYSLSSHFDNNELIDDILYDYYSNNKESIWSNDYIIKNIKNENVLEFLNIIPLHILLDDSITKQNIFINNKDIFNYLIKRIRNELLFGYYSIIPVVINKILDIKQKTTSQTLSNLFIILYEVITNNNNSLFITNFISKLFESDNYIIHKYCVLLIYNIYMMSKSKDLLECVINSIIISKNNKILPILLYYIPLEPNILSYKLSDSSNEFLMNNKDNLSFYLYLISLNEINVYHPYNILKLLSKETSPNILIKILPKLYYKQIKDIKSPDYFNFICYFNDNYIDLLIKNINEENNNIIIDFIKEYIKNNYCNYYLSTYITNNVRNNQDILNLSYLWSVFPLLNLISIQSTCHKIITEYIYKFKIQIRINEYPDLINTLKYITDQNEIFDKKKSEIWLKKYLVDDITFDKIIMSFFLIDDLTSNDIILKLLDIIYIQQDNIDYCIKLLNILLDNNKELIQNILKSNFENYKVFITNYIKKYYNNLEYLTLLNEHLEKLGIDICDWKETGYSLLLDENNDIYLNDNSLELDKVQSIYLKIILKMIINSSNKPKKEDLLKVLKHYNVSFSERDVILYKIIILFREKNLHLSSLEFRYGKYVELAPNEESLTRNMEWIFNIIDQNRLRISIEHMNDILLENNEIICKCNKFKNSIYNPQFLLELLCFSLTSTNVLPKYYVTSNFLGYCICCMSLNDKDIRVLSYRFLALYYDILLQAKFNEKLEVQCLLKSLKNSITKPCCYIPSLITVFLYESLNILMKPQNNLYKSINKFLINKPSIDLKDIPMFYTLLNSGNEEYKSDRGWIMRYLLKALQTKEDYNTCLKKHIFTVLFSYFDSSIADTYTRLLILRIVKRCTNITDNIINLYNSGLLWSWISNVLLSSQSMIFFNNIISLVYNLFKTLQSDNALLLPLCIDFINVLQTIIIKLNVKSSNYSKNIIYLISECILINCKVLSDKVKTFSNEIWNIMSQVVIDFINIILKYNDNFENDMILDNNQTYSDIQNDFQFDIDINDKNNTFNNIIKSICYIRPQYLSNDNYLFLSKYIFSHYDVYNEELTLSIKMYIIKSIKSPNILSYLQDNNELLLNVLNVITTLSLSTLEENKDIINILFQSNLLQENTNYYIFLSKFKSNI